MRTTTAHTRDRAPSTNARRVGRHRLVAASAAITLCAIAAPRTASADPGDNRGSSPVLVGRAVLDVDTYAPGPVSGAFYTGPSNGIAFPLPSQPVEGFSAIIDGRRAGELLAMPDNGFGTKPNSRDFLIRAYYIEPDFRTDAGGSGDITVGDFISFRDPNHLIGFTIVNDATSERLLTGGDIDPESLQRDHHGDLWVGDEFGPWILHFDASGVLVAPPVVVPGLKSPNNPFLAGAAPTQPNSRGFEATAITPNGKLIYAALEGATVADTGSTLRRVFEFDVRAGAFTGREWVYRTEAAPYMIADMVALDGGELAVIERDGGLGVTAVFRRVYAVDIDVAPGGQLGKRLLIDLAHIPDPDLLSLPAEHPGDIRLGPDFGVVCESVEAIHAVRGHELMIGCDNNFPNRGRNPGLADDTELILVDLSSAST